jgi:hypothetical protein
MVFVPALKSITGRAQLDRHYAREDNFKTNFSATCRSLMLGAERPARATIES